MHAARADSVSVYYEMVKPSLSPQAYMYNDTDRPTDVALSNT